LHGCADAVEERIGVSHPQRRPSRAVTRDAGASRTSVHGSASSARGGAGADDAGTDVLGVGERSTAIQMRDARVKVMRPQDISTARLPAGDATTFGRSRERQPPFGRDVSHGAERPNGNAQQATGRPEPREGRTDACRATSLMRRCPGVFRDPSPRAYIRAWGLPGRSSTTLCPAVSRPGFAHWIAATPWRSSFSRLRRAKTGEGERDGAALRERKPGIVTEHIRRTVA
jgi:hypothetical protein